MTSTNPYKAPSADVNNASTRTYTPKIFSLSGRIGRLRYLAYAMASYLLLLPGAIVVAIGNATGGEGSIITMAGLALLALGYIALIVFVFALAKRRLNDMDKSGWFSLLFIIPLVNIFVGLWMLFSSGQKTENRFGRPPSANSTGVKVAACIFPVIMILGIVSAVALPAYQDYLIRAQQAAE